MNDITAIIPCPASNWTRQLFRLEDNTPRVPALQDVVRSLYVNPLPANTGQSRMHGPGIMETFDTNVLEPPFNGRKAETLRTVDEVYVKWGFDELRKGSLLYEALVYNEALYEVQGLLVPRLIGLFTYPTIRPQVVCLVFEHIRFNSLASIKNIGPDLRERIVTAVRALHGIGVSHNALSHTAAHILITREGLVRFVDFTRAQIHFCLGPLVYTHKHGRGKLAAGCRELCWVEARYGEQELENSDELVPTTEREVLAPTIDSMASTFGSMSVQSMPVVQQQNPIGWGRPPPSRIVHNQAQRNADNANHSNIMNV